MSKSVIILIVLVFQVLSIESQAGFKPVLDFCKFSVYDYEIELIPSYDFGKQCIKMDVVFDGEYTKYSCEATKTGSMTATEIMNDETIKFLLKRSKIRSKKVESLTYTGVSLDDDGGGLYLLRATMKASGTVKSSGVLTHMGGAAAAVCESE